MPSRCGTAGVGIVTLGGPVRPGLDCDGMLDHSEPGWLADVPSSPARGRTWLRWAAVAMAAILVAGLVVVPHIIPVPAQLAAGATPPDPSTVRVAGAAPATFDPAQASDSGTAAVLAQVFEGLTAFDSALQVRPALASSWQFANGGRSLTFQLRSGIRFSDGTPITAQDVVQSWLRLLDPRNPSPLASLLDDITGAVPYREGHGPASAVGVTAQGSQVTVHFIAPANYFLAVAASPSLAIVPPQEVGRLAAPQAPTPFVGSGAYVVSAQTSSTLTLQANPDYWAGPAPISTVQVVTDLGGQNPVDAFRAGTVDYADISSYDASWIRYDRTLGPQLRQIVPLSVDYYGFDTRKAPFDNVQVRRAFAQGVDWARIVDLADVGATPATSIVPPGVPGRSSANYVLPYDPAAARAALAAAGYPGGRGFPSVTLVTDGGVYDDAVVAQLQANLGVKVALEIMPADEYFTRLSSDPPAFWSLSWIADYPSQQDFLGLLLGSGSTANYGGWNDPAFDAALSSAAAAGDPAAEAAAYAQAQAIVRDQVPVIPVSYTGGWALSRTGLLGAIESGTGIMRYAGLAWSKSNP